MLTNANHPANPTSAVAVPPTVPSLAPPDAPLPRLPARAPTRRGVAKRGIVRLHDGRHETILDAGRARPRSPRVRAGVGTEAGQGEGAVQEELQHHHEVLQVGLPDGAPVGPAA